MKTDAWKWMAAVYLLATSTLTLSAWQRKTIPRRTTNIDIISTNSLIWERSAVPRASFTTNDGIGVGSKILSNQGSLTGSADTPVPDPNSPNCFGFTADCFITHAFRWEDGSLKDLGTLPGVNSSQGTGINELGWIAGLSQIGVTDPILGGNASHAVLWRGRRLTDLGTLGGYESFAVSVNVAGEVIGLSHR